MNEEYYNIAEGDLRKLLSQISETQGNNAVAQNGKANMEQILIHYITCTWGLLVQV